MSGSAARSAAGAVVFLVALIVVVWLGASDPLADSARSGEQGVVGGAAPPPRRSPRTSAPAGAPGRPPPPPVGQPPAPGDDAGDDLVGELDVDPETQAARDELRAQLRELRRLLATEDPEAAARAQQAAAAALAGEVVTSGRAGPELVNQLHSAHVRGAMAAWGVADEGPDPDAADEARTEAFEAARAWLDQSAESGKDTILPQRYCEAAAGSTEPCRIR